MTQPLNQIGPCGDGVAARLTAVGCPPVETRPAAGNRGRSFSGRRRFMVDAVQGADGRWWKFTRRGWWKVRA